MLSLSGCISVSVAFTNGQNGSVVIGQPGFTSRSCGLSQTQLCFPINGKFDSKGNLWVDDSSNGRVLEFVPPFTSGPAASIVIGKPDFSSDACALERKGTCSTFGRTSDSKGDLWVVEVGDVRVLEFKPPFSTGMNASLVIGQPNFSSQDCHFTRSGLCAPQGAAFDSAGNLWV